ncbi:MAG: pyridoxal phosphate-dependent aminotransferase, partial [Bdellovibrionales bacterium]|nr:pyridoxal phosphate-dependent aminotransferase [Bdellovibrionales bacterium]
MENYTSKLLSGLSDELNNYITYTNSPKTDIDLSIGQLQVPIPTSVKETLMNGVDLESCNYVSPSGLNKLREAYKQYLVASDSKVSLTNTLITCGAKEAIFLALSAFTDGSATLLVPQTCWPGYHLIARGLGLEVVNYAINRVDWLHNLRSSIEQFPNSTLVLNTPHNPTGTEIHMNDLISIVDCCKQKRVAIVLDGVYADFTRGRSSLSSQDTIDIL